MAPPHPFHSETENDSIIKVFEHAYYIGNYLSGILYGLELALYYNILEKLRHSKEIHRKCKRRFLATFSTISVILFTIDITCNAIWGELMWINGRELPLGVHGFFHDQVRAWYQTLGFTTVVIMIFMGNALLLHRFYIIWGSNWKMMVLPIFVYLTAFGLAILQLISSGKPGGNFFGKESTIYGTPYLVLTIGLNIFVTVMIYGRLHWLITSLNTMPPYRLHINPAGAFIESAALYSISGTFFLVPYALESQTAIAFGQVWAKMTFICPQMIILRMAAGQAWNRESINESETTMNGQISSVVDVDV